MNKYSDFEVQKVREADIRLFVRGVHLTFEKGPG